MMFCTCIHPNIYVPQRGMLSLWSVCACAEAPDSCCDAMRA